MKLRVLLGVFVLGLTLWGAAGANAQTTETPTPTPEVTSPAVTPAPDATAPAPADQGAGAAEETTSPDTDEVPPVEVVQPKPKPTVKVVQPPRPKPVAKRPAPTPPAPPPRAVVPEVADQPAPIGAETVGSVMGAGTLVPMSPVPGAEIPLNKVPSGVSIVNGSDFARENYVDTPAEILQQRVPGIIIDDLQGNQFQTNIQFRGFEVPRRSTACRRGLPSTRTACASTSCSATSSTTTSCRRSPSTTWRW